MRKQIEAEDGMRSVIRDELAMQPLISVQNMRMALYKNGYRSSGNLTLDWHYVSKLMRKTRIENVANLSRENRDARLAKVKERHRVLTEKLGEIVDGKPLMTFDGMMYPTQHDRIAAANTIMKWDIALLYAEEQVKELSEKEQPQKQLTETKTVTLTHSISETKQIPEFAQP